MAKKIALSPATVDGITKGTLADLLTPGLAIEVLPSGKKRWRYRRQIAGSTVVVTMFGGLYPARAISEARAWAREQNEKVEAGLDPRAIQRDERARAEMTVAKAHELYMTAAREGRSSKAKRPNKEKTIAGKIKIYKANIAPTLSHRSIYDVTEDDLVRLVEKKGRTAKTMANRLAVELGVFFGWASSLKGCEVGLTFNPAKRLHDLHFPESPRGRILDIQEIGWFLQSLVPEKRHFQRGFLLLLLSAARISEVRQAKTSEIHGDVWIIPASRTKSSREHRIALGPWGRSLMVSNHEWIFPSPVNDGPLAHGIWYFIRNRILARMRKISGKKIEHFTPHDLRRTARSNTKRLDTDYETAEAMLNHAKRGLEKTYDLYDLEEEKRAWFLTWEAEIIKIAESIGVANALGAKVGPPKNGYTFKVDLPKRASAEPALNIGTAKSWASPKFAQTTAKFVFTWKPGKPTLSESVDLPPRQSR